MKKLYVLILFSILFLLFDSKGFAAETSAGSSAALLRPQKEKAPDSRVTILKEFLRQYNSPLVPFAADFVEIADKYNLDWKLLAAISGVESTFGMQIPYASFNGWGWGVYGNNVIYFSSWKEGIEIVSRGLKENYINKGARNIYDIGKTYAESPTWAARVEYFIQKIDEFRSKETISNISLSL